MAITVSSLFGNLLNAVLNKFRGSRNSTRSTPSTPAPRRTDSNTVARDPRFDLHTFHYQPVSSREKLPVYDAEPCGMVLRYTNEGGHNILYFCNFHWITNPKVLLGVLRFRQNAMNPALTRNLRDKAMQQMLHLAAHNQPQSAVRKYRVSRIGGFEKIPPEVSEDLHHTLTQLCPPRMRQNRNESALP